MRNKNEPERLYTIQGNSETGIETPEINFPAIREILTTVTGNEELINNMDEEDLTMAVLAIDHAITIQALSDVGESTIPEIIGRLATMIAGILCFGDNNDIKARAAVGSAIEQDIEQYGANRLALLSWKNGMISVAVEPSIGESMADDDVSESVQGQCHYAISALTSAIGELAAEQIRAGSAKSDVIDHIMGSLVQSLNSSISGLRIEAEPLSDHLSDLMDGVKDSTKKKHLLS